MPTLTIDGVDLAYDDVGSGSPIVCLHAIGHDALDFEPLEKALAPSHRVIALDWPGHGRSGADREAPSSARYAELLGRFLDALHIEKPILIGNSIGGAAALRVASSRPVERLVIANNGGLFIRSFVTKLATRAFSRFFRAGARGASWFPRAFAAYYRMVLSQPSARAQRDRIIARHREVAPILEAAWRVFGDPSDDIRPLVEKVECPVLVSWAMGDRFNPLWASMPAIKRFHDVRVTKHKAGHNPFLEDTDKFLESFRSFAA